MQIPAYSQHAVFEVMQQLDEYAAGIDPEFDAQYESLEFEFAALRLHFPAR